MQLNTIYLIVAPSGAGKTTLVEMLEKTGFTSIQSYTTRPKRHKNETGHIFITDDEFNEIENSFQIVAFTNYNGYRYCATQEQVENNTLYVIDPSGIDFFKHHYKGNKSIRTIYLKTSIFKRIHRMYKRGDKITQIINRLFNDRKEFKDIKQNTDFIINNNKDINKAYYELLGIMRRQIALGCELRNIKDNNGDDQ